MGSARACSSPSISVSTMELASRNLGGLLPFRVPKDSPPAVSTDHDLGTLTEGMPAPRDWIGQTMSNSWPTPALATCRDTGPRQQGGQEPGTVRSGGGLSQTGTLPSPPGPEIHAGVIALCDPWLWVARLADPRDNMHSGSYSGSSSHPTSPGLHLPGRDEGCGIFLVVLTRYFVPSELLMRLT